MWQYLKSREFWITLIIILVLTVGGFFALFYLFLPSYTQHNESVIVPEVTKLPLDEAIDLLEAEGLRYEIADSSYKPGFKPLGIIRQDPGAMKKVKPNRRIYLTVNKKVPPVVKFPDIRFVSNYQAKLRLESWGLSIDSIKYVAYPYRNVVVHAELEGEKLEEGAELPVGTRVVLVVGRGKGSSLVETPKLTGLSYENAISVIHETGLNIGSLRFQKDAPEEKGQVIKQYPKYLPGDSLNLGSSVDLIIAGPEPEQAIEGLIREDDGQE